LQQNGVFMQRVRNVIIYGELDHRSSELLLSISTTKIRQLQTASLLSTFSTSTPARSQSPQPPVSFADQSPLSAEVLTQPVSISLTPGPPSHASQATYSNDIRTREADLENQEQDVILAARACFDAREFHRATHLLTKCISLKAKFLRLYCQFIVSGKLIIVKYNCNYPASGLRKESSEGLA
jgi:anaphase-promoting complex subunit 8